MRRRSTSSRTISVDGLHRNIEYLLANIMWGFFDSVPGLLERVVEHGGEDEHADVVEHGAGRDADQDG